MEDGLKELCQLQLQKAQRAVGSTGAGPDVAVVGLIPSIRSVSPTHFLPLHHFFLHWTISVTLKMEPVCFSEASGHLTTTQCRDTQEVQLLVSSHHENMETFIEFLIKGSEFLF